MKTQFSSALILAGLFSAQAIADPTGSTYIGFQFAQVTYDESGFDSFDPTALVGRFGHYYNKNFSLEGRVGFGLSEDSRTYPGGTLEVEVDSLFGVYGVGHLPLNDVASVYALAGFSRGELTFRAITPTDSASASGDDSGFSYGVGAEFNIAPTASVTVEYASFLDETDYQATGISAGVNFSF